MKLDIDNKIALMRSVEHSLGWSGAPELHSLETDELIMELGSYLRENYEQLAELDIAEIEIKLKEDFGRQLSDAEYYSLSRKVSKSLEAFPEPEKVSDLMLGDLISVEGYRMLFKGVRGDRLELIVKDENGGIAHAEIPVPGAEELLIQSETEVRRGVTALFRRGDREAMPVRLMRDLRRGDVVYHTEGSQDEILDSQNGELTIHSLSMEGVSRVWNYLPEESDKVTGVVDRLYFDSAFSEIETPDFLVDRLKELRNKKVSPIAGSVLAEKTLTGLEENLADVLMVVTDRMAETFHPVCNQYYGEKLPVRLDRRFTYLQYLMNDAHMVVASMKQNLEALNFLVSPLPEKACFLGPEEALTESVNEEWGGTYSECFQETQELLYLEFIKYVQTTGIVLRRHLPDSSVAPMAYEALCVQLKDFQSLVDKIFDTAAKAYESLELIYPDFLPEQSLAVRHEKNPDIKVFEQLSEIAETYRYDVPDIDKPSGLHNHPERYDRGITLAESPVEKFQQAVDAGAEIVSCYQGNHIVGFALYFPPEAITTDLQEDWQIEGSVPTAFLAYTAVRPELQGGAAHDMLLNATLTHLKRHGAMQLDLQIFSDNFASAVAHIRYGAKPNGVIQRHADAGVFKGFSITLEPEEYLLKAVGKNPESEIRDFIVSAPEVSNWQEVLDLWKSNQSRLEILQSGDGPNRPAEEAFREGLDLTLRSSIYESEKTHSRDGWQDFINGRLESFSGKAIDVVNSMLRSYTESLKAMLQASVA